MRTVSVRLEDLQKIVIPIGFVGENEHTRVMIDSRKVLDEYPNATASLVVAPEYGEAYPAVVTRDGDTVVWDVTDSDLVNEGRGEIQLSFVVGEVVAKSYIGTVKVLRSIMPTGEIPDPIDDWLTRANATLGMLNGITGSGETLEPGESVTVEITDVEGHKNIKIGVPKGEKGDTGAAGYSPSASVSKEGHTATITITDKSGTTTVQVTDGADGQDGYSPSASVRKAGNTVTITITDKTGTTTAQVMDGADGQDGITPNVTAGTTTTGEPGTDASVTRRAGSPDSAPVFDFTIPRGDKGETGEVSEAELEAVENKKADVIIDSVSNQPIATVTDGANGMPVPELVVGIEPVQDLHGLDAPYPPGGGKNLVNPANVIQGYFTESTLAITQSDKHITVIVDSLKAGTYTFKVWWNDSARLLRKYQDGAVSQMSTNSNTYTFTSTTDGVFAICFRQVDSEVIATVPNVQIESGSYATDFAPYSNICPISGRTGMNVSRTGENLFGGDMLADTIVELVNGAEKDTTNKTVTYLASKISNVEIFSDFKPNTQYTFIIKEATGSNSKNLRIIYADGTNTKLGTGNITVSTAGKSVRCLSGVWTSGTSKLLYEECGVFEGVITEQDFATYQGETIEHEFPQEAGTVYEGSLTVNEDGTGTLVVLNGTKSITISSSNVSRANTNTSGKYRFNITVSLSDAELPSATNKLCGALFDLGEEITADNTYVCSGKGFAVRSETTLIYYSNATSEMTKEEFISFIGSSVQIVYPLATPVTYQLTDLEVIETLKVMNLWADTGDILLMEYPCDTKAYIEKRLSASQSLMELIVTANREDSMKATKAYSSGNLLIVNGTLYRATTSIANGATLTIGTNVTATTVAAEIAALA